MPALAAAETSSSASDDSGFRPVHITVDQTGVDPRKTLAMRVTAGAPGAVDPVDPEGGWTRVEAYIHNLPSEVSLLKIGIQVEGLVWSATQSNVYFNSIRWATMTFGKTHKELVITREQLEDNVVVFGMWYSTSPNHEDPLDAEVINGALRLHEIFDDGDESQSGIKSFRLSATRSDASDEKQRNIVAGGRDIVSAGTAH